MTAWRVVMTSGLTRSACFGRAAASSSALRIAGAWVMRTPVISQARPAAVRLFRREPLVLRIGFAHADGAEHAIVQQQNDALAPCWDGRPYRSSVAVNREKPCVHRDGCGNAGRKRTTRANGGRDRPLGLTSLRVL
jgi:hypothetical protein